MGKQKERMKQFLKIAEFSNGEIHLRKAKEKKPYPGCRQMKHKDIFIVINLRMQRWSLTFILSF